MTIPIFDAIRAALDGAAGGERGPEIAVVGQGALASCFDVTGLAAASIAAAAGEVARLAPTSSGALARVEVDRRLASLWFGFSLRPIGWQLASPWDPIAGDYRTRDGWIQLHTNAPHHRMAALRVLRVAAEKKAVETAVATWDGESLEAAVVEAGGCAAQMRSESGWRAHPQGAAVRAEPLIAWRTTAWTDSRRASSKSASPAAGRPLAGIRVLDLTRVLAGPVATRFLAAYGAEVLRIDPPDWEEPAVVPEVTLGKRCAGLDLERAVDRERFEALLAGADVLVHGYRPGALARRGYDDEKIRAANPSLVDVALCAYGWTGPWRARRGFDSLVQRSSGIAEAGQRSSGSERPSPLPVQALDHATGYLMAAAVLRGIRLRREQGLVATARLSLARTAALLIDAGASPSVVPLASETAEDLAPEVEQTQWGPARRIRFPARIEGCEASFGLPARGLRTVAAEWNSRLR